MAKRSPLNRRKPNTFDNVKAKIDVKAKIQEEDD
jgi:hypothetical protein